MKKTKDIKSTKKVQDYWANRPRIERFLIIGIGINVFLDPNINNVYKQDFKDIY